MLETCKICEQNQANTRHHVIPKMFTDSRIVKVCVGCHKEINFYFSNYELYKLAKKNVFPTTKEFNKLLEERRKDVSSTRLKEEKSK